jgi:hypothetical protein
MNGPTHPDRTFSTLTKRERRIAVTSFDWALRAMRDTCEQLGESPEVVCDAILSDPRWEDRLIAKPEGREALA